MDVKRAKDRGSGNPSANSDYFRGLFSQEPGTQRMGAWLSGHIGSLIAIW
jgi:hypothetical protein